MRFELEMSDRQEMVRDKVRDLARLGKKRPTMRSRSEKQEIQQTKERLITLLDDPVYQEESEAVAGISEAVKEMQEA